MTPLNIKTKVLVLLEKTKKFFRYHVMFRKPVGQMFEGVSPDIQIIGWHKADWYRNKRGKVVQCKYFVRIDLWIVVIRFGWLYPFKIK